MSGGKPALSSRVMGLKFMQRGREKEQRAAAEEAAEERDVEAHWVVEGARTRCVVLAEGDPPPCASGAGGRLSFGGFSRETEALQAGESEREKADAAAAAEAANPDGKAVSDAAMAASLQQKKKQRQHGQADGGDRRHPHERQHGSGGKKQQRRGRDEEEAGVPQAKKSRQRARYFD